LRAPRGFWRHKDDYADWLITELEKFDAPVDLVATTGERY